MKQIPKVLLVFFLIFSIKIHSAIITTTVNHTCYGGVYYYDINQDMIDDFNIELFSVGMCLFHCHSYNIDFVQVNNNNIVAGYDYSDPMTTYSWTSANQISLNNFGNGQKKFVAIRFNTSNGTYYGWIELQVSFGSVSFKVSRYAYESTTNTPIFAGQTESIIGLLEFSHEFTLKCFPIPSADGLLNIDESINKVSVMNMFGNQITEREIAEGKLDLSILKEKPGVYFILCYRDRIYLGRKKIVISEMKN